MSSVLFLSQLIFCRYWLELLGNPEKIPDNDQNYSWLSACYLTVQRISMIFHLDVITRYHQL